MSVQRNVIQQNAETLAEIRRVAAAFEAGEAQIPWLDELLAARGLFSHQGVLIKLGRIPEQADDLVFGMWLAGSYEFWEFEVLVSRENGAVMAVEQFENVTAAVAVSANAPGTGKSFGFLARQVLLEVGSG